MARIGLYFGSFNPIHIGHLIVAEYFLNHGPFDEVWFVVSPQNPFKTNDSLIDENLRLNWVRKATESEPRFVVCDAEFNLPKPSYTIQTLQFLQAAYPHQFDIIIGADNLQKLNEWKSIDEICQRCEFYVYGRRNTGPEIIPAAVVIHHFETPLIDISATHIRQQLSQGKSVRYLVPDSILTELENFFL
jgi:nicotinate-nucleotide adenylyltransferase